MAFVEKVFETVVRDLRTPRSAAVLLLALALAGVGGWAAFPYLRGTIEHAIADVPPVKLLAGAGALGLAVGLAIATLVFGAAASARRAVTRWFGRRATVRREREHLERLVRGYDREHRNMLTRVCAARRGPNVERFVVEHSDSAVFRDLRAAGLVEVVTESQYPPRVTLRLPEQHADFLTQTVAAENARDIREFLGDLGTAPSPFRDLLLLFAVPSNSPGHTTRGPQSVSVPHTTKRVAIVLILELHGIVHIDPPVTRKGRRAFDDPVKYTVSLEAQARTLVRDYLGREPTADAVVLDPELKAMPKEDSEEHSTSGLVG